MNEQMDCLKFRAHLDEWLDGELTDDMARAMQQHADTCPDCAEDARLARETVAMLHSLEDEIPVPLPAQAAWRKAVRAEAQRKKVRRFPAAIRAIGSVAAALVVLAGCTAAFRATDMLYPAAPASDAAVMTRMTADSGVSYTRSGDAPMQLQGVPAVYVASDGDADDLISVASEPAMNEAARSIEPEAPVQTLAPMLIRSVERTITTDNFDGAGQNIRDLTEQYGGYLATDATTTAASGLRTGEFTAVIPAVEADSFLQTIDHVGSVTYTAEHYEDASASVHDIQSRITALQAEQDRINQLLAEAASADEIAQLSALMQANIAEMHALESETNRLNSDLNNVRVFIRLEELYVSSTLSPTAEPALRELMGTAFQQSAGNFQSFVRDMAVTLMILAPYLLAAAVVLLVVLAAIWLVLHIRRK